MGVPSNIEIAPGVLMPMIGFGTWALRFPYDAVRAALEAGYRHFDTAYQYQNEGEIGRALRDSGISREDVFITTKITASRIGLEEETIASSLRDLQTDYVDLWLIHDPPPPWKSEKLWEFMTQLRERGQARTVGVSEYSTGQLDSIVAAVGVTPAVNQIRWAPALFDQVRLREMRDRKVTLEGFSALRLTDLDSPRLLEIAEVHGVTASQVLLRWHIDHGVVAIPRSGTPERIRANLDVWDFQLTEPELDIIDAMSVVTGPGTDYPKVPVGSVGTIISPTGRPTGAGEIEIVGQPSLLAWSLEHLSVGTVARVIGYRGVRAVEVEAAEVDIGEEL
jgi:diketogulonate reductase-like aldo/keto reductase